MYTGVNDFGKMHKHLNTCMTIHIDLDDLIDRLETDQPLTESDRLFLIAVCNAMYREDTLDHLSEPTVKH
jgi:hypothetical protein